MSDDRYAAPESEILNDKQDELASRWKRLGASLLDTIILMLVIIPVMFLTGGFSGVASGEPPSFLYNLVIGIIGLVIFVLINGKFLVSSGQTIGKKALGIKIVDMQGNLPTLGDHLVKRYAVFMLPGQVPIIGPLFSIINVLFVFRSDTRCIHDLAGGTKVVDC